MVELQKQLEEYKKLFMMQLDEITKLNKDLEDTRNRLNVVSRAEYDGVISELNNVLERYDVLKKTHKKTEIKPGTLKNDNWILRCENDELRKRVTGLKQSAVIKTEHNARGAGRKRIEIDKKVIELRNEGAKIKQISQKLNIGTATVSRILKRIK
jgi:DNA-binding NtrC family response regulator